MYFITEKDPDYRVKGSRDPLGFQVVWQEAGRRLIPHLSTVCNSIRDFQILSLAFILKEKFQIKNSIPFETFFLKLKTVMSYTRFENTGEKIL